MFSSDVRLVTAGSSEKTGSDDYKILFEGAANKNVAAFSAGLSDILPLKYI
jgi:hypothetical protein